MGAETTLPALIVATISALGLQGRPTLLLAVSGGRDSAVLLDAASRAWPAEALWVGHVHHGLQPQADDWLVFCRRLAERAGLRFDHRRLPPCDERGIENWARRHRYLALADMAEQAGAALVLTAHHANDQLETAQMRRLRGAGPLGLSAMRIVSPLPGRPGLRLVRPFLGVARATLARYAGERGLDWVEDPSNGDLRQTRNRIRARLDAAIAEDPTTLPRGLAAIDAMQRESDARQRLARSDLAAVRLELASAFDHGGGSPSGVIRPATTAAGGTASLSRAALLRLSVERADEAIRYWLGTLGCRMPSRAKLAEIRRQLLSAASAQGRVHHDGRWLLRYRDRIASLPELPLPVEPTWFRWQGEAALTIGSVTFDIVPMPACEPAAALSAAPPATMDGIDPARLQADALLLDQARSTDQLRVVAGGHRRRWKNLAQERGIPAWLRPALPVLRNSAGELLFAAPFGADQPARSAPPGAAAPDASGAATARVRIQWRAPETLTGWL